MGEQHPSVRPGGKPKSRPQAGGLERFFGVGRQSAALSLRRALVEGRLNTSPRAMSARRSYYITTPIYYVNDSPHIGHAYTTLSCDVLARFMRLDGCDVHFLTGTDEHGQKVEKSAAAAGLDPQAFTDRVSQNFRDLAKAMNFSNDDFIRTTEERHKKSCQEIWRRLK